jgi:hypothetical protein
MATRNRHDQQAKNHSTSRSRSEPSPQLSICQKHQQTCTKETPGIISEHQYGQSHQTCLTPVLNKILTVQLLKQKKTNGIVFDNDAKGCYDRIVSEIALAALRRIGYSKNSVLMLGLLWAQFAHHVAT